MVLAICNMVWPFLKRLNIQLPYGPAILLLGYMLKGTEHTGLPKPCAWVFTAALFRIVQRWKQPIRPSVDGRITKYGPSIQ